ncbi:MAG TPA: hypothetical protein VFO60_01145 [Candidatus Dormibacteraeota bacterium]|nr:hypothetical protein [Candidatus Dormibacteraeota bacterium]
MNRLRWLKRVAVDLPRNLELTYCLLRDPRVPVARKGALLAALAFIASPIDLPAWIPIVGEADILLLTLVATGVFVDTAPAEIVEEHRQAITEHRSVFDRDVERGRRLAVMISERVRKQRESGVAEVPGTPVAQDAPAPVDVRMAS